MTTSPRLLDLFTGTGSVARVAEELGYEVHTLDIDRRCKPDICADILEFDYEKAFAALDLSAVAIQSRKSKYSSSSSIFSMVSIVFILCE